MAGKIFKSVTGGLLDKNGIIAKFAGPIAALSGVGLPLSVALGAAGGLLGGGGLKGALAGGLSGASFAGGGSFLGSALGATGATASALGSGLLGAASGGITGGLKGALTGGALGGLGGYAQGGGFDNTIGSIKSGLGLQGASNTTSPALGSASAGQGAAASAYSAPDSGYLGGLIDDDSLVGQGLNGISDAYDSVSSGVSDAYNGSLLDDAIGTSAKPLQGPTNLITDAGPGNGAPLAGTVPGSGLLGQISKFSPPITSENTNGLLGGNNMANQSPWTSLLSGGLGVYSNDASEAALLEQQQKNQALLAPFLNAKFTPGDLTQDPGYLFQQEQGEKGLGRAQAARGNYFSGQALQEASQFNTGLADQTYKDAFNRWVQTQGLNMNAAGAFAQTNENMGNIKSNSISNTNNVLSGALAGILGGRGISNTGAQLGGDDNILAQLLARRSQYGV